MRLDKDDFFGLFDAWKDEVDKLLILFQKKHESYGPDNISATGINGIIIRMWDKINRLRRRIIENNPETLTDEQLVDSLADIANYAIIGLLLLHNIWPEFDEKGEN